MMRILRIIKEMFIPGLDLVFIGVKTLNQHHLHLKELLRNAATCWVFQVPVITIEQDQKNVVPPAPANTKDPKGHAVRVAILQEHCPHT